MNIESQNPLAITDVKDSRGNTVPNYGSTDSTLLVVFGQGSANTVVTVLDNDAPVGTASVRSDSRWEKSVYDLTPGAHSFNVRATDGMVSPPWVVNVGSTLVLPAPTVIGAPGGVLNPMDALSGARVVVSYDGMATTDLIGLSWDGQDNLVPPQNGSAFGSVTFTLPPAEVGAVLGKTIGVLYAVVRNGTPKPSELLQLQVLPLPQSALSAPKIRQAPDDQNLDISRLNVDPDLYVPVWPFIAAGQQISLRFEGAKVDGSAYSWPHETWQNLPITSGGEPNTKVKLSDLRLLRDGSALKLIFEVSFDGGITKASFPVKELVLIIEEKYSSGAEDFRNENPGFLPLNTPVRFNSGLVFTATPAGPVNVPRIVQGGWFYSGNPIVDRFDFTGLANHIMINYTNRHVQTNNFEFYDASGTLIDRVFIEGHQGTLLREFSRHFSYCILNVDEGTGFSDGVALTLIGWRNV